VAIASRARAVGCGAMGVLIAADMEGIAGIEDYVARTAVADSS
jgi:hypothetical protein